MSSCNNTTIPDMPTSPAAQAAMGYAERQMDMFDELLDLPVPEFTREQLHQAGYRTGGWVSEINGTRYTGKQAKTAQKTISRALEGTPLKNLILDLFNESYGTQFERSQILKMINNLRTVDLYESSYEKQLEAITEIMRQRYVAARTLQVYLHPQVLSLYMKDYKTRMKDKKFKTNLDNARTTASNLLRQDREMFGETGILLLAYDHKGEKFSLTNRKAGDNFRDMLANILSNWERFQPIASTMTTEHKKGVVNLHINDLINQLNPSSFGNLNKLKSELDSFFKKNEADIIEPYLNELNNFINFDFIIGTVNTAMYQLAKQDALVDYESAASMFNIVGALFPFVHSRLYLDDFKYKIKGVKDISSPKEQAAMLRNNWNETKLIMRVLSRVFSDKSEGNRALHQLLQRGHTVPASVFSFYAKGLQGESYRRMMKLLDIRIEQVIKSIETHKGNYVSKEDFRKYIKEVREQQETKVSY